MRAPILILLAALALPAQTTIQFEDSPATLRVGESAPIGAFLQTASGLRQTDGLVYTSEIPEWLQVASDGTLKGLWPGEATVTVTDPATQTTAAWTLTIVPARILLTPARVELTVGETATFTAEAVDMNGAKLNGLAFRFSTGLGPVARVDGARLTALAVGQTFVSAQLEGLSRGGGTFATASVWVNPKPVYQTRPLLTSAKETMASPISYSKIVTANNRTAVIAGFDNGGQAAILLDGTQQKVLVSAGQTADDNGTMIFRLLGISLNNQGDVAVYVETGGVWCGASIMLYPRNGPTEQIQLGCSGWLSPRSMGNDGSLIYYADASGSVIKRTARGDFQTLLERNKTIPGLGPIRDFQTMTAGGDGSLMIRIFPATGSEFYALYDGTKWAKVFSPGDIIDFQLVNSIDSVVAGGAGVFYYRAIGSGFNVIGSVDLAGKRKILVKQNDPSDAPIRMNWNHRLVAASADNLLMVASMVVNDKYDDYLVWIKPRAAMQTIQRAYWNGFTDANVTATGVVTVLSADSSVKLVRAGSSTDILLSATAKLAVPPATQWRSLRLTNRDSWLAGADDGFLRASDGKPAMLPGTMLPNQAALVRSGAVNTHTAGWSLFPAYSSHAEGYYLANGNRTTLLADTAARTTDVSGRPLNWLDTYNAAARTALNSRGDAIYPAGLNGVNTFMLHRQGEPLPRPLIGLPGALPANLGLTSWVHRVDLDDSGTSYYWADISGGGRVVFSINGATQRSMISTKESFEGVPVSETAQAFLRNGNAFVMYASPSLSGYQFALGSGGNLSRIDFSQPDRGGITLTNLPGGYCDIAQNGEIFFVGETLDFRNPILHYSPATRKLRVVVTPGQKLADGATLMRAYQISAGPNGSFFFAAQVSLRDQIYMAVYEATPAP